MRQTSLLDKHAILYSAADLKWESCSALDSSACSSVAETDCSWESQAGVDSTDSSVSIFWTAPPAMISIMNPSTAQPTLYLSKTAHQHALQFYNCTLQVHHSFSDVAQALQHYVHKTLRDGLLTTYTDTSAILVSAQRKEKKRLRLLASIK